MSTDLHMGAELSEHGTRLQECVRRNPFSAMLTVYGVGFGVGAALGLAAVARRYWRPPMTTAERLGRQILDAIHGVVPESVSRRFS